MITAQTIEDLASQGIRAYQANMFYLWLIARFGNNRWACFHDMVEFPKSKRQIQRYLAKLEECEMIEVEYREFDRKYVRPK